MTVRLFVLGALRRGPRHGYLLRREAVVDQTDSWAGIKPGSIYAALGALESGGLVRVASIGQDAGPAKTTFEITADGRESLTESLRTTLTAAEVPPDPFDVALRLGDELDDTDLRGALMARRDGLAARVRELRAVLAAVGQHLTTWEAHAFDHVIARTEFESGWTTRLIDQLGGQ